MKLNQITSKTEKERLAKYIHLIKPA